MTLLPITSHPIPSRSIPSRSIPFLLIPAHKPIKHRSILDTNTDTDTDTDTDNDTDNDTDTNTYDIGTYEEGGPPVEVADLISQSFPRYAVKEVEKRVTQVIKSLDKSVSSFVPFVSSSTRVLYFSCLRVDECSFSYLRVFPLLPSRRGTSSKILRY